MVTDIISTIVDTIQGLLQGIGTGVVSYFEGLLLEPDTANPGEYLDSLNSVGTFVFVLLGIGAAFGLATLVFNMVRSRS